jgi:hypothetical protein
MEIVFNGVAASEGKKRGTPTHMPSAALVVTRGAYKMSAPAPRILQIRQFVSCGPSLDRRATCDRVLIRHHV